MRKAVRDIFAVLLMVGPACSQGVIGTFAGTEFLFPFDRTLATDAPLGQVQDVVVDGAGNFIVTDRDNHIVVRVTPAGALTVIAGNGLEGYSGDGGLGISASFRGPQGVAIDASGSIYVSDVFDNRIRKVSAADGTVSTFAGTGQAGYSGDGQATANQLNQPRGLAFDSAGNLYVADYNNNRIRRITPSGVMNTLAVPINLPNSVRFDGIGNLYIASNDGVTKIAPNNSQTSLGTSVVAGLAVDLQNNLYVSAPISNAVIRIAPNGASIIVAGIGGAGFSGDGGTATAAMLNQPGGLAYDTVSNTLYIADRINLRVRKVDASQKINTAAGNGRYRFSGDGQQAAGAALYQPAGLVIDGQGSLLIADLTNNRVRKVTPDGIINTVAGNGISNFSGDGGPATQTALNSPEDITVDASGFYIADKANNRVRKVDLNGNISTVAGNGMPGFGGDNNPAIKANLNFPFALARDASGNIYIADEFNGRIRKVAPDNTITTVAGGGSSTADNVPATTASLSAPQGVAVDSASRIFLSDTGHNRIRVVSGGTITTYAGGGTDAGENVSATSALLDSPRGLVLDKDGNLYYAERNSNRVRRVSPAGKVATVAGVGGPAGGYFGDGGLAVNAQLNGPVALAVDGGGNLYISDSNNNRIRKVFKSPPAVQVSPTSLSFTETAGGFRSAPRLIDINSNSLSGLPYIATLVNNSPWLRVFPLAGGTPASLEVSADPANLSPGLYSEIIHIATPNANPPSTDVNVQFTVGSPGQPLQLVQPDALSFAFTKGSSPRSQVLMVTNIGGGSLDFTAAAARTGTVNWLSVQPQSGTAKATVPVSLSVTANPGSLLEGVYTGAITVTPVTGGIRQVAVTMTITAVAQTIRLSQMGLTFTAVAGGGMIPPESFSVLNVGSGVMGWNTSVIAQRDAPIFLTLDTPTGATDAGSLKVPSVKVSANASALPPGEYFNQIKVESSTALNSPQFIPVILEVLTPDHSPGPAVRPSELVFSAIVGGSLPSSQDLMLYNIKGGALNFRSQAVTLNGINWVTYLPTDAAMDPNRSTRLVVQPDTSKLDAGIHQGVITLQFDDGNARKVNVLAVVLSPPAAGGKSIRAAQAGCTPKELVLSLSVLGQGFTVPASYPVALVAKVVDDCNNPLTDGAVSATFSVGEPVVLGPLKDGTWTATWIPAASAQNIIVTLTAEGPGGVMRKSIELRGTTRATAATPKISSGGVVNAASFAARQPLAPGTIISIFGTDLAMGAGSAPSLPLGRLLAGATVLVKDQQLPLTYASDKQVNAILPYNLNLNTEYQVFISNNGRLSTGEKITVAAAQPAIFMVGPVPAIVDVKGVLVQPGNPVHAGDVVLIFAAGLGAPITPVAPGEAPGAVEVAATVSLTIGNKPAVLYYKGFAPTFPGLYQINSGIPEGISPADDVPLVLTVAGRAAPTVTIPVR